MDSNRRSTLLRHRVFPLGLLRFLLLFRGFLTQDTSVVEKRRSLQAKKQRLLKGLETLMRMAPDLVATRPGGMVDDYMSESAHGYLQQHDSSARCASLRRGRRCCCCCCR